MSLKTGFLCLIFLICTSFLISCADTGSRADAAPSEASDSPPASKAQSGLTKVYLSGQPSMHTVGLYAAREKGWFEEAGLSAEISIYLTGEEQLASMSSDGWSVGIMGIPAGITGIMSYDLSVLAFSGDDAEAVWIVADAGSDIVSQGKGHLNGFKDIYGTKESWKGKQILCTKGSMSHLALIASLQALGLSPDDVNIVHKSLSDSWQAFRAGEADMVCLWNGYDYMPEIQKNNYVIVSSAEAAGLYAPSIVAASKEAMADEETTQKILDIIMKGIFWAEANREEAAQYYYKLCRENGVPVSEETAAVSAENARVSSPDECRKMLEQHSYSETLRQTMEYFVLAGIWQEEDIDKAAGSFREDMLETALENYAAGQE